GGAAGGDVEAGGGGFHGEGVGSRVAAEEAGGRGGGAQGNVGGGGGEHHGVDGPAIALEIGGGRDFHAGAVALVDVERAGVVGGGEPFGKDRVGVVGAETEMALGDGDADALVI